MTRRLQAAVVAGATLAVLITASGCDHKRRGGGGGGGGGTQPPTPTNPVPTAFARGHVNMLSSWSYSVTTTTTPYNDSPTTVYDVWYYRVNNTSSSGNDTFYSVDVSASAGSDMNPHAETWKLNDDALVVDFGGTAETMLVKFPMSIGTTWQTGNAYEFGHSGQTTFTCNGTDNLSTNRGMLYAFRVAFHNEKQESSYGSTYTNTTYGTMWVAPGHGLVKFNSTQYWGYSGMTRVTQADVT